ncbi:MAG: methionine gamma-lyase [Ilumatobacter coccineus]|uniref:homocysteine desulfhydrase n=1 Tax=Ilumatobacter coccineus TaxID=467094 RepID=A0A2G6K8B9_9ACTN|nr:MAG: methionine gamma-lyase [Ilumatobacter coccineus]
MHHHSDHPESMMMGYGYHPEWSEGAIKPPLFQSSTFVFRSAAEGKAFFELAHGQRDAEPDETMGLIYSRINNPNVEIFEDRICLWDKAEAAAAFESGMAAISATLLAHLRPGDIILHGEPLYGGTDHLMRHILPRYGIEYLGFDPSADIDDLVALAESAPGRVAMIYIETPTNPTNDLYDIEMCAKAAKRLSTDDQQVLVAVDNTYLGPLWQHPLEHGADLVIYSATKYIGGHSDVLAGAVLGSANLIGPIKELRTFTGSVANPWTGWLLCRSLETLKVRMEAQGRNAHKVADWLKDHPKVAEVSYLGHLQPGDKGYDLWQRQCKGGGAMLSVWLDTDEAGAFRFLDNLHQFHLAVSLGSTESLAQHPATMTHSGIPLDVLERLRVTPGLVRLSIGIEHPDDLIADLEAALKAV